MNEFRLFDMLGDTLASAVNDARTKTGDDTIMVRIEAAQHIVERGGKDLQGGLSEDGCVAYLAGLK